MFSHIHSGVEFEQFIINGLIEAGLAVSDTPASGDYGADLIFEYRGARFAGQCKFYSSPVGLQAVQEILGALNYYQADFGIVFTNSTFTQQAHNLANANHVLLMDGAALEAFAYYPEGIPAFDTFMDSSCQVPMQTPPPADWIMNDLVIRYGMSKDMIMKNFMSAGLPHIKVGRAYHFDPQKVKQWEIIQRQVPYGRNGYYTLPAYASRGRALQRQLKQAKAAGDREAVKRIKRQLIDEGYTPSIGRRLLLAILITLGIAGPILLILYCSGFL